jgi:uncharacterized protein YprB with RNaseH-like and TPR domain
MNSKPEARSRYGLGPNGVRSAYLDIETTGLSPEYSELTVIGIGLDAGTHIEVIQLIEGEINRTRVLEILDGIDRVYTYNGARFDLPFIRAKLRIHIAGQLEHRDLMHECHARDLHGGLKGVERKLGIPRKLKGINGRAAVDLWYRYINAGDEDALKLLLAYNREDVVNLRELRRKLGA